MTTVLISNQKHILDLLKEHITQQVEITGTIPAITGKFQGEDVVLVDFPSLPAEVHQPLGQLAENTEITRVVFLGAGEACHEHLRPGDLVVGGEVLSGETETVQMIHADHRLVDLCLKAVEENQEEWAIRALVGNICPTPSIPDELKTGICCADTAAVAIGVACARGNIPFVPLCMIRPGEGDTAAWEVFNRESGARAFRVVKGLLEELKKAVAPTTRALTTDITRAICDD